MASKVTAPLFAADGAASGDVNLDPAFFAIEPNIPVMHQVVTAQLAAARSGTHNTKTRAEARGGGRKPWRQKGLGRARHGSIRSPIWVGGGVAHGPKPRDYSQRTPKKMKQLAMRSALSARAESGQVRVLEDLSWPAPKTSRAKDLLEKIDAGPKVLVVLTRKDQAAYLSLRNLPTVIVNDSSQLNTYDVVWADTVVFTSEALDHVTGAGGFEVTESDFVKEQADPSSEAEDGDE